jgi:hypothetical protein
VLVKGLDFSLLARIKAQLSSQSTRSAEEIESEIEKVFSTGGGEAGGPQGQSRSPSLRKHPRKTRPYQQRQRSRRPRAGRSGHGTSLSPDREGRRRADISTSKRGLSRVHLMSARRQRRRNRTKERLTVS